MQDLDVDRLSPDSTNKKEVQAQSQSRSVVVKPDSSVAALLDQSRNPVNFSHEEMTVLSESRSLAGNDLLKVAVEKDTSIYFNHMFPYLTQSAQSVDQFKKALTLCAEISRNNKAKVIQERLVRSSGNYREMVSLPNSILEKLSVTEFMDFAAELIQQKGVVLVDSKDGYKVEYVFDELLPLFANFVKKHPKEGFQLVQKYPEFFQGIGSQHEFALLTQYQLSGARFDILDSLGQLDNTADLGKFLQDFLTYEFRENDQDRTETIIENFKVVVLKNAIRLFESHGDFQPLLDAYATWLGNKKMGFFVERQLFELFLPVLILSSQSEEEFKDRFKAIQDAHNMNGMLDETLKRYAHLFIQKNFFHLYEKYGEKEFVQPMSLSQELLENHGENLLDSCLKRLQSSEPIENVNEIQQYLKSYLEKRVQKSDWICQKNFSALIQLCFFPDFREIATDAIQACLFSESSRYVRNTDFRSLLLELATSQPQIYLQIYERNQAEFNSLETQFFRNYSLNEYLQMDYAQIAKSAQRLEQRRMMELSPFLEMFLTEVQAALSNVQVASLLQELSLVMSTATGDEQKQLASFIQNELADVILAKANETLQKSKPTYQDFRRKVDWLKKVSPALSTILVTLPAEAKFSMLPELLKKNSVNQAYQRSEVLLDLDTILDSVSDDELLDHLQDLIDFIREMPAVEMGNLSYAVVLECMSRNLNRLAQNRPEELIHVIQKCLHTTDSHADQTRLIKLMLLAETFMPENLVARAEYQKTRIKLEGQYNGRLTKLIEPDGSKRFHYYLELQGAYIDQENLRHTEIIDKNIDILEKLQKINAVLPAAKQMENIDTWLEENQESIAKVQLLFPDMGHSNQFLFETARVHGFHRLTERLKMVELFTYDEIVAVNLILVNFPREQFTSATIYDIISQHAAFANPKINKSSEWLLILAAEAKKPEANLKTVFEAVSRELLFVIAEGVGIDRTKVREGNLKEWNLPYLVKLIEGLQLLESRDRVEDAQIFRIVIKSAMRNEFAELIDPTGPELDATVYSEEEIATIGFMREHNQLTRERFASRGLSIEAFHRGTERRLTGRMTDTQILSAANVRLQRNFESTLGEVKDLQPYGVDFSARILQLEKQFEELQNGTPATDQGVATPGLKDVTTYYSERRKKASETKRFSTERRFTITDQEKTLVNQEILQVLAIFFGMENIVQDSAGRIQLRDRNEASTREKLGLLKESGLNRVINTTKEGYTGVKDFSELETALAALQEKLPRITHPDSAQLSQRITGLVEFLSGRQNDTAAKTEIVKPNLSEHSQRITNSLQLLSIEIQQLAITADNQLKQQLELVLDHLNGRKAEVTDVLEIADQAKDQDYDVTIKRWDRTDVGFEIFVGCYVDCCVAIDNFNNFGFLRFLTGEDTEIYKIIDNNKGPDENGNEVVEGAVFDFVAEDRDNKLYLTTDNIELNSGLQFLGQTIIEQVAAMSGEVADNMSRQARANGQKGIEGLILGDNYNDVPTDSLSKAAVDIRQVAGPHAGLHRYLDVFVKHVPHALDRHNNPGAFERTQVNVLPYQRDLAELQARQPDVVFAAPEVLTGSDQELHQEWEEIKDDAIALERETFGLLGETPEELEEYFTDPNNIVILSKSEGKLVGYSLALPNSSEPETAYVKSSAVDYESQSSGIGKDINAEMVAELKRRGYKQISRDAMADTNYAQTLIRRAIKDGTLISPEPKLGPDGKIDPELTIDKAELGEYMTRPQIHVVTRIP